jgi:PAS domain S-box-containing protein
MRTQVKNPKTSQGLTATLAIAFAALSVAVLIVSGSIQMYFDFRAQREIIAGKQQLIAHEAANEVASFIQEKFSILEAAIKLGDPAAASGKDKKKFLRILLGLEPAFRHLVLLDAHQRKSAEATRLSRASSKNLTDRIEGDLFSRGKQGSNHIGSVTLDDITSEPMVIMAVPVTDIFGDFQGILIAEVNLKFMWDLVDGLKIGESGLAYVVNRQGDLIAFGDTGRVLKGENVSRLKEVDEFLNNTTSVDETGANISTGIHGTAIVGTYVPLGTPDWAVVIELPVREAYGKVIQNTVISAGILLIMAILAGLAGVHVARRLAAPIINLTETASRIAKGETRLTAPVEGPREIAFLAGAFNNMTRQLIRMVGRERERGHDLQREVVRRKEIEEALRESEERLDLALSAANEGIWDWELKNNTVQFDSRYYTISGYAPNEFPGTFHEWEKRVHPDDIQKTKLSIRRYLSGDLENYDAEFRFLRKDGDYMWIQGKGKIVARNKQGDPTRFIGTHSDITERKQIEESLRMTQFSFDRAAVGIYRIGSDGKILEVNDCAARIIGYTKGELTAMSIFDINPLVNKENWSTLWQSLCERGLDPFETVHRRKDGREIPVEINPNLFEYDGQQYSIAFTQDITERKRAEEELLQLRNYLSNIIDSMPSVLVGVDAEGRVTQWNKTAEQTTGIAADEAHGKTLSHVMPQMASKIQNIIRSIHSRQVIRDPKRPRPSEDGTCYEDVTIYPLITNGAEGAVIRIDDVTDRVRLEEMMIQGEKMLSVGGLAAGMAHEINNPLAGIMQTAEVMANRLGNLHMPANRKAAKAAGTTLTALESFMTARGIPRMLNNINTSGRRVATIVDNMLSFARKSEATVSFHALDELLDKTLELAATDYDLKKEYDFKRIEIHREYVDGLPAVPCEEAKIQQVLLNLLRNGAQAMQEAGTKSPRFMVRTHFEKERQMVRMEIEDNGPGMDEETRKRVFEPFFTTKPAGVGTGLGLSVSYFIITENHYGEMAVESHLGSGATFIIRLPIHWV